MPLTWWRPRESDKQQSKFKPLEIHSGSYTSQKHTNPYMEQACEAS